MASIEPITFCSVGSNRLSLQIKKERKGFSTTGEVEIIGAENAEFENGVFITDDPEKIELIRKSTAFKEKRIIELAPGQEAPVPQRQQTIRGPVSTSVFRGELDLPTEKTLVKISEQGGTVCPECGDVFEEDFNGKKVRMHNIAKHRKKIELQKVGEK